MRVLLIDDNNTNLAILTKIVERMEGFEAISYSSPSEVMRSLPEINFDLAVIDYQMPVYNGIDLIQAFISRP